MIAGSVEELLVGTLREVRKPYQPLLDYFRNGHGQLFGELSTQPAAAGIPASAPAVTNKPVLPSLIAKTNPAPQGVRLKQNLAQNTDINLIARFPAKAKPCRSCPALSGGLCRCALKSAGRA